MKAKKASKLLLKRLELYLDYLKTLQDTVTYISATTIAKALELGDVQVRKDLARVSCGGMKKVGRLRKQLIRDIECFLDYGDITNAVLIGAGKLGQALMAYPGFDAAGIKLLAGFDVCAESTCAVGEKQIHPLNQLVPFCTDNKVHVGIITVPQEAAQEACDRLVSCGISAIWNFAPTSLCVPDHIIVLNENLAVSVHALRLQLDQQRQQI